MRGDGMRRRRLNSLVLSDYIIIVFLLLFGIAVLYPFYNSVLVSLVSEVDYFRTPFMLFPRNIIWDSYILVLMDGQIFSGMRVTAFVTFFGVIYNMFLTLLCAYALTKPFPGRKFITMIIIFTVYFTGGLIPNYLLIRDLGLMDNLWAMILPTGVHFMYMVVLRRNFESIPASLEESAKIDGANDITVLLRIVLPLSKPIIATFTLFYAVDRWNEWWFGLLYMRSPDRQPLQLIIRSVVQGVSLMTESSAAMVTQIFGEGVQMAATVVSILPIMILFPLLQRYFISGLVVGAVKE